MGKRLFLICLVFLFGINLYVNGEETGKSKDSPVFKKLADCAKNNKYLFVMFYKNASDSVTREMEAVFDKAESTLSRKAYFLKIDVSDKKEKEFIDNYEINKVAKPAILALAPGGIVTKGFIRKVSLDEIGKAILSPKTLEMVKANAEKKLIILLFSNESMKDSKNAEEIVNTVVKEQSKKSPLRVISVDPKDKEEAELLKQAKVSKDIDSPVVVVMQDGTIKGSLESRKITGKALTDLLTASCGSDCGPSG